MLELIKIAKKRFDDFFEQQRYHIYCATTLVLLIDVMIAIPFIMGFNHTHLVRNFITFGSSYHTGSFTQFASYGMQWLAFVDVFILAPAIIWSMLMPSIVAYVKKMEKEQE